MKSILFLIMIILSLQSCQSWEDELTKKRIPYNGKEFRIDGCYFRPTENNDCYYLFFYSNGVVLSFNDSCNITSKEQFKPILPNLRMYWSIFQVEGKTITKTEWVEANLFSMSTANRTYKIENDTTLLYINQYNEIIYYHFKKFSPKPDSTNIYIK